MSEAESPTVPAKLRGWLEGAVDLQASDLHLIVGYPPVIRLNGTLTPLPDPPLTAEETEPLLLSVCPPDSLSRLHENKNTDFSFGIPIGRQLTRFRASYFNAGQQLGACFRLIPNAIPDFEWAGFPPKLAARLANLRDGLVILTGPTGSGKTTTLAMVVQNLNSQGGCRIISIRPVNPRRVFGAGVGVLRG